MIWHPRAGQAVQLRYAPARRALTPHGARGIVTVAAIGPGPINALVRLDDGRAFVVPRGNLFPTDKKDHTP